MTKTAMLLLVAAVAACTPAARPTTMRRLGSAMAELGARFTRAGRAVLADRWGLANYDIVELNEVVKQDWTDASWKGNQNVERLAREFASTTVPSLQMTVRGRDRSAAATVFATAARACNACHVAAGVDFIEVPEALGAESPALAPTGSPASRSPAR
jgi:hypothetical protein